MEEIKEIKGLVLNIFERGENDALIKVLSSDQIYYFICKGFYKLESKNKSQILIGSISMFEYFTSYGNDWTFLLKKANLVVSFDFNDKFNWNITKKLFNIFQQLEEPNQEFFITYEKYLMEEDFFNKNLLITYLLFLSLSTKGRKIVTTYCIKCKRKNQLYCFDLEEGGMLCFNHKTFGGISLLERVRAFYFLGVSWEEYKHNTNESINSYLYKLFVNFLNY